MGWIYWLFQEAVSVQRDIYLAFAARIRTFAETGDWWQLAIFLPMGIVFGAVHAMTPGHSKIVLATYLAGSPAKVRQALGVSLLLSFVHVSMAVAIALLALPLVSVALGTVGRAPLMEDVSRGLLGLIGLWMIWQALRPPAHSHAAGQNTAFAIMSGLIPCPLTLFVMTFAIARKVPEAGIAFALVMMIGVAATLSMVALAALAFRAGLLRVLDQRPSFYHRVGAALQFAAGVILLAVAAHEIATR